MEEVQVAHLAGVFDAVGSATVHVNRNDKYSIGFQYQPIIRLHRPKSDEVLLGKIQAYAEDEGVRHHISEKSHGSDRDSSSYEFVVNDPESIERFLKPMLPFLVSKFDAADILLDEVIPGVKENKHTDREGFLELMGPADRLREMTQYGTKPKYDKQFFEEEWDATAASA